MVLSLVIGKRTSENLTTVVQDFADRTGHVPPELTTIDDCSAYAEVLLQQYGKEIPVEQANHIGHPSEPIVEWPKNASYATVKKTYRKGHVVATQREQVHGTSQDLVDALKNSPVSEKINTSFVERQNGTERMYNSRKARKTYAFSKSLLVHVAVSYWVLVCYNFHHIHRGLRIKQEDGTFLHRTPAMAKGLAERPWTILDLLTRQVVGFVPNASPTLADFKKSAFSGAAP